MSRAFVREPDGADFIEDLPERPIGDERNLVTPRGLAQIEAEIERLRGQLADAQGRGARAAIAETSRDLRYWAARRSSAELVPTQADLSEVRFGHAVTIERDDGRRQRYQIVGVDEADPVQGLISYVSPLATALVGGRPGDEIDAGPSQATIVAIEAG